jgi:hypothetical protein
MGLLVTVLDNGYDYKFLRLSTDDPQNTFLTADDSSVPLYTVRTALDGLETRISKGTETETGHAHTLARVKLLNHGNGKIAFGDKTAVKLSSWLRTKRYEDSYVSFNLLCALHRLTCSDNSPIHIEEEGKKFVCKISFLGQVAVSEPSLLTSLSGTDAVL